MLHFVTSYMKQNKSRKQTVKTAQYGLEIIFKEALSQEFCCFQLHLLVKFLPSTFPRSQNAQMD